MLSLVNYPSSGSEDETTDDHDSIKLSQKQESRTNIFENSSIINQAS